MLLALLLTACSTGPQPVALSFAAELAGQPFSCQESYPLPDGRALRFNDLRVFVHDLQLVDDKGTHHPVALDSSSPWQTEALALLDFEDGTGSCRNGSAPTHTTLTGAADGGPWTGLQFKVGVPFADNHADPAKAQAPLSLTSMHWSWQGGYKFLRLDADLGESSTLVHLGSTGCAGTIGDMSACGQPNRPQVTLDGDPTAGVVVMQLNPLLQPDTLDQGCMGAASHPGCAPVFAAVGLDAAQGTANGNQQVFVLR